LEAILSYLLSQGVTFLADPDRVIPQLRAEDPLDEQDGFESRYVDIIEQPPESPVYALACYSKGFVDLFAIRAFKHHMAGLGRPELNRQLFRFHQLLQGLQELLVLLCQFHSFSP